VSLTDQDQIDHLVVDLTRELGEQIGPETDSEEVKRVYSSFYKARIRQYVPVLTRRIVREELRRPHAQSAATISDLGPLSRERKARYELTTASEQSSRYPENERRANGAKSGLAR